jgi:hypothetical protein
LDSGDHYGRGWERAALKEVGEAQPTVLSVKYGYIDVTIDMKSYLSAFLEYDTKADRSFQDWIDANPGSASYWQDIQGFIDSIPGLTGIYGDGEPITFNTYNEENLLSGTIQGAFFHTPWGEDLPYGFTEAEPYLIFHTHNGCDVRGGYGKPRVFSFSGRQDAESLFSWSSAYIAPTLPEGSAGEDFRGWNTDDSCHWYTDDQERANDLETYDIVEDLEDFPQLQPGIPGTDLIWEDDNGVVYCPITGSALRASGFHGE